MYLDYLNYWNYSSWRFIGAWPTNLRIKAPDLQLRSAGPSALLNTTRTPAFSPAASRRARISGSNAIRVRSSISDFEGICPSTRGGAASKAAQGRQRQISISSLAGPAQSPWVDIPQRTAVSVSPATEFWGVRDVHSSDSEHECVDMPCRQTGRRRSSECDTAGSKRSVRVRVPSGFVRAGGRGGPIGRLCRGFRPAVAHTPSVPASELCPGLYPTAPVR